MGDQTRKFESETIGRSGMPRPSANEEPCDVDAADFTKARHQEGPDKAQNRIIVLRLIQYFEEGSSGLRDL